MKNVSGELTGGGNRARGTVFEALALRYLIRIINSSDCHPIVRQIASTRSRDFAMIVISECDGLCNTIQERMTYPSVRRT